MNTSNGIAETDSLKNVMDRFVGSYTERDKSVDFSLWLAECLQQEIPDIPDGAGQRLSEKIIEAVAGFDQTLGNLNKAIDAGQSKEEWLADQVFDACGEMPVNDAGDRLQQINSEMESGNTGLMREIIEVPADDVTVVDESVDWNKYSIKGKALDIGKQAVMSGLGAAANIVKQNIESGEPTDINSVIGKAIESGMETAKGEVKAVVAGAIKTVAEKRLTDLLPSDTPTETICDIAGVAVESASALLDAATGKSTMAEALDKAGRSSVAAACRIATEALKGSLATIPYVGPLVVQFAGGLLDHMASSKFAENVYTVVRDAAVATWEGIKQAGRNMINKLKTSMVEQLQA